MRKAVTYLAVLVAVVVWYAIAYAYHLGYSRGSRDESLHWLVSFNHGVVTARENPEHPLMPRPHYRLKGGAVNVVTDSVLAQYQHDGPTSRSQLNGKETVKFCDDIRLSSPLATAAR